jgi:hypothetical protein
MIFEALHESWARGELLLMDGGLCRYHLRRDGQVTIQEILSTKRGAGQAMLAHLRQLPGAVALVARCPTDLPSNAWWRKQGFELIETTSTRTGRSLNLWRCLL